MAKFKPAAVDAPVLDQAVELDADASMPAPRHGRREPLHWSYEGPGGPQAWGRLAPGFAACANGTRQSPIDILDGLHVQMDPVRFDYRPSAFRVMPAQRGYFTYMGSLTTPPCSEGVLWIVMKQPVPVSPEQIGIFARLYPMNARPVQSAAGRIIKESD